MNAQEPVYPFRHLLFGRLAMAGAHLGGGAGECGGASRSGSDAKGELRELPGPKASGAAAAERAARPSSPDPSSFLAKGQLWKLEGAYVEIVDLNQRLVLYRVLKQKGYKALTRVLKREAFAGYLKEQAATLAD